MLQRVSILLITQTLKIQLIVNEYQFYSNNASDDISSNIIISLFTHAYTLSNHTLCIFNTAQKLIPILCAYTVRLGLIAFGLPLPLPYPEFNWIEKVINFNLAMNYKFCGQMRSDQGQKRTALFAYGSPGVRIYNFNKRPPEIGARAFFAVIYTSPSPGISHCTGLHTRNPEKTRPDPQSIVSQIMFQSFLISSCLLYNWNGGGARFRSTSSPFRIAHFCSAMFALQKANSRGVGNPQNVETAMWIVRDFFTPPPSEIFRYCELIRCDVTNLDNFQRFNNACMKLES